MGVSGLNQIVNGICFDQLSGLGAVPNNQEIQYLGMVVMMRPSTFLSLSERVVIPKSSVDYLAEALRSRRAIASPFLKIDIPNDPMGVPEVVGHEGRHRSLAIMEVAGDVPVPVHLFPRSLRARHLKDELVARLRAGMMREDAWQFVPGPLFEEAWVEGRLVPAASEK